MKNKTSLVLLLAAAVAVTTTAVSAEEIVVAKADKAQNQGGEKNKNVEVVKTTEADAAPEVAVASAEETTAPETKSNAKNTKGQANAAAHRSVVATFVKSLLEVADREGGIGAQVRVVAQQQNAAKEEVAEDIAAVESRSKLKTFFLGSDYKNLGALRSQMVQTRNQIEQLKRLSDKAENEQTKAELQTQIQVLEQEQADIDAFITQNENQFSLFGWAVKLFQ